MTRFERCLEQVKRWEGEWSNHPADPGGATMFGITQATLAAWRGAPVTAEEVRYLTWAEASRIYRARFWQPIAAELMPPGVDLSVFDFAVNAGPRRAAQLLQRVVGVLQDSVIGPITLQACGAMRPAALIDRYASGRMDHYRALTTFRTFGRGWTNRTAGIHAAAQAMAAEVWSPGEV